MYAVILAGGSGTRFWPLSRQKRPKQLISLFGGRSMLQRTVERVLSMGPKRILVITNTFQAEESRRQLREYYRLSKIDIIEEPVGRNTAPAIGLAASIIARYDPDGMMLILPADHYIANESEFCNTVKKGELAAKDGSLVTMGIEPTSPETGYGYIEADRDTSELGGPYAVRRFVEKPDLRKAMEYLESGCYYWNSGMFIWKVDAILDQIAALMPELTAALADLVFSEDIWELEDLKPQIEHIYGRIKGESIDYGVMEKAANVKVIPSNFGWSDVGSWSAVPEVSESDEDGNVFIGPSGVISIDSSGSVVYAEGKIVAMVGVKDLIVADAEDALLICAKERAQDVKRVVAEIAKRELTEYL